MTIGAVTDWMDAGKPLSDDELRDTYDHVANGYGVNALEFVPRVKATIAARDEKIASILAINATEHETSVMMQARVAQLEAALRECIVAVNADGYRDSAWEVRRIVNTALKGTP